MTERVCAFCGRPVAGLGDALEVEGASFCSPGHLLSFESRQASRRHHRGARIAVPSALIALMVLLGGLWSFHAFGSGSSSGLPRGFRAPVDSRTASYSYSWQKTAGCLYNSLIPVKTLVFVHRPGSHGKMPGLVAETNTYASFTSSTFDDLTLYFFKRPSLARASASRAATDGLSTSDLPKSLQTWVNRLGGAIPNRVSAYESLVMVYGSAVAVWEYPRETPRASVRTLSARLAAGRQKPRPTG